MPRWVRRDLEDAVRVLATPSPTPPDAVDDVLYRDWYLRRSELGEDPEPPPLVAMNLVGALQASHHRDGCWDAGWTVEGVSNRGRVAVGRDGQRRVLDRIDVLPDDLTRAGLPLRPGDVARVSARVDGISPDGGFWVTWGDGWHDPPSGATVRFYWDVGCAGAPRLVETVTRELRAGGVPYLLKLPVEPAAYCRADAAVLYLATPAVAAALPVLRRIHAAVASLLRPPTPRLAFRLAPGVATAEDPPTGESFGQHRCRLIAEAAGEGAGVERILERFDEEGIDPRRPYANPGSTLSLVPWR